MRALLARVTKWLRRLFRSSVESAPVVKQVAKLPRRKKSAGAAKGETFGSFYYLDNILEELDDYFKALRALRSHDEDAYAFYSKVGAQVTSQRGVVAADDLPTVLAGDLPSMGMVHYTKSDEKDWITPAFVYFSKIAAREGVEVSNGDMFEVTMFYYDHAKGKGICVGVFYVAVTPDGAVRLLRSRSRVVVPLKNGRKEGIPTIRWRCPQLLMDMAADRKRAGSDVNTTPQDLAAFIFKTVANLSIYASDGVQVRCKRNNLAATFNVDMLRTPYFFKDREKTVTESGRTKRIFHIARAHKRVSADGTEAYVKSHFRGLRRFKWNGYDVTITVPGLHHSPLQWFTGKTYTLEHKLPVSILDSAEVGDAISRHMEAAE